MFPFRLPSLALVLANVFYLILWLLESMLEHFAINAAIFVSMITQLVYPIISFHVLAHPARCLSNLRTPIVVLFACIIHSQCERTYAHVSPICIRCINIYL
jgi:putative effector of murein hydrolase